MVGNKLDTTGHKRMERIGRTGCNLAGTGSAVVEQDNLRQNNPELSGTEKNINFNASFITPQQSILSLTTLYPKLPVWCKFTLNKNKLKTNS